MKRIVKRVLHGLGYEVLPLTGHRRVPTMESALNWLAANDIEVSTVLDVGASDGRWSRQCLRAFPNASYVLYEPQPVHLPGIAQLLGERPDQVRHVPAAVGAVDGTAAFDGSDAFGGGFLDGMAGEADTIEVPVARIDSSVEDLELEGPFLLKLDTHGFEHGILEGAENMLGEATVLIIEAYAHRLASEGLYFWELCAYLYERGFRPVDLVDVMHREFDDSLWQMDLVFLRRDWSGFNSRSYR